MTPTMLSKILGHREEVSAGGLVTVSTCIESHFESDGIVWMRRRESIGPTLCGCEIECAIVDGEDWKIEKEATGFSHFGCPVAWFNRAAVKDWDWRDEVWERAEAALAGDAED